jgi:thymidine kinase
MKGHIKGILGPMYSGKTTTMTNDVERYHIANKRCIIIRHADDKRYDHLIKNGGVVPHDLIERSTVPTVSVQKLASADELAQSFDVIGIDEAQFFDDCPEYAQKWANEGKTVIWAALDGDYRARPFGRIHELLPMCEDIVKLKAVCMLCYNDASFTARIETPRGDTVVDIGGKEKYMAVCRQCMWK